jgi:hypothetical protein
VDNFFVKQPLDLREGGSNPPRPLKPLGPPEPSGYFGLPMMDLGRPPLPPNRPYHHPLIYPKYVKDSDLDAHFEVFKIAIITNGEINDVEIVNLFTYILKNIMFDWCNYYLGDYPNCTFAKLLLFFCKVQKVQNDEQVYLELKSMKQEKE